MKKQLTSFSISMSNDTNQKGVSDCEILLILLPNPLIHVVFQKCTIVTELQLHCTCVMYDFNYFTLHSF